MNLPTRKYAQDLRRYYRLPVVQVSLTLVLSIFVVSTFIVFALRPTILSIITLRATIKESNKIQEQLNNKITNLQKITAQLETLKPFLPTLNINIPNNGAMYTPLAHDIEILANQAEVVIENESIGSTLLFSRIFTPFSPNKKQAVISLPFNIRITGSYSSVSSFLSNILSMERVIMIESVTVTKATASKNTGALVSLNISGNAYYLADEAQLQKSMALVKGGK